MQTQPMEDIDAVLGRFQAWVGARNATEAKPGVRELSYEEALQSSRYRWKGVSTPLHKSKTDPGAGSNMVPDAASERETARAEAARVKDGDTKPKAARNNRGKRHAARTSLRATRQSVAKEAQPAANPAFREALAEAMRPTAAIVAAQPAEIARQTTISIRLAHAERALIRTRAAEAGISASAYMRQCVLEIEQLRIQVQQALAAMERRVPASISPPAPAASSAQGFFARLAQKIF